MTDDVLSWSQARARVQHFRRQLDPVWASPDDSVGAVLAMPLVALTDLPAYDTATVDGWAVSGPGPWRIRPPRARDIFAGLTYYEASDHTLLRDGQAAPVTAGESLGDGVTGVVSHRVAVVEDTLLRTTSDGRNGANYCPPGSGVRPRGTDAGAGSQLLPAGQTVTPAVAALAAVAGHDVINVRPMPQVAVVRIGAGVLDMGVARSGFGRDPVTPALPGWIGGINGRAQPARIVTEGDAELVAVIDDLIADMVVTCGQDSDEAIRRVLHGMHAQVLVDSVACSPGSSMLLAQLPDGRALVHVGDTPMNAIAALSTLAAPIISALTGLPDPQLQGRMEEAVVGDRRRTTLMPMSFSNVRNNGVVLCRPGGPSGLFALSVADCLAVIPPEGRRTNEAVTLLPLRHS